MVGIVNKVYTERGSWNQTCVGSTLNSLIAISLKNLYRDFASIEFQH